MILIVLTISIGTEYYNDDKKLSLLTNSLSSLSIIAHYNITFQFCGLVVEHTATTIVIVLRKTLKYKERQNLNTNYS